MTTADAAATFDVRSFTRCKRRRSDDASARGRLECAARAAASGRRARLELAGRRAGAPTVRLRLGPVRRGTASRDRHRSRGRRVGPRACFRDGVVCGIGPRGRSRADDPHARRVLRDTAATRVHLGAARGGGRRGRAGRRGRRERRRGHARGAPAPRRAAHRRGGGLPRPAHVSARALQGGGPPAGARVGAPAAGAAAAGPDRPARRAARPGCAGRGGGPTVPYSFARLGAGRRPPDDGAGRRGRRPRGRRRGAAAGAARTRRSPSATAGGPADDSDGEPRSAAPRRRAPTGGRDSASGRDRPRATRSRACRAPHDRFTARPA